MTRFDIMLRNRLGHPVVVVEVKNLRGTSGDWAAAFRQNILAHGDFPQIEYFLLVTPDRLYIWKGGDAEAIPPTSEVDARPVFSSYIERAGLDPDNISSRAFELVVSSWLEDLLRSDGVGEAGWLKTLGLLDAIQAGQLEYEAAA